MPKPVAKQKKKVVRKVAARPTKVTAAPVGSLVRINKHMADIGLASRRQADELIEMGNVLVNGVKAVPGQKVTVGKDKVEIKGGSQKYVYYAYNKPMGIITTGAQGDEEDILTHTKFKKKVFPVGRLDKNSHGLILMTDDRRITHRLLDPEHDHEKEYRVTLGRAMNQEFINSMGRGVKIDGERTKPVTIMREGDRSFRIILTEGRNRQIRRMVEAAGHAVEDLMRLRIEHIKLGDIKDGAYRSLSSQEISTLLRKLGLK